MVFNHVDEDWRYPQELLKQEGEEPIEEQTAEQPQKMKSRVRRERRKRNKNKTVQMNVVQFQKMIEDVKIPTKATEGSAGYDLTITEDIEILPGEITTTDINIIVKIPEGYYGQIKPRSSLAKVGLTINGGVVDSDYRGTIQIILVNRSKLTTMRAYKGDRIAQLILIKIYQGETEEVDIQNDTQRGTGGFGSTGINAVVIKKTITDFKHAKDDEEESKHTYQLGTLLTIQQKEQVMRLLEDYEDVLATDFKQLKLKSPKYLHDCDTGDHPPIKMRPYRMPYAYQEWQDEEVEKMKKNTITIDSHSPWGFANVLAPKKGAKPGEFAPRMCTNFRPLNDITRKDAYPLPRIDDILDTLKGNPEYFSGLDLFSGYYQIELTPRVQERAAFVTHRGHYEYTRMP